MKCCEASSVDDKRATTKHDKTQLLEVKKVWKRQRFFTSSDSEELEQVSGSVFENM